MSQFKTEGLICLIDSDSLLYESASIFEDEVDFGTGEVLIEIDEDGAINHLNKSIEEIVTATGCETYEMYVTGPTNFRYDVLPTYKHNRKDTKKPEMVGMLKQYVLDNHPCKITNKIEADDACTILLSRCPNKYILAHIDKDLNQVEGLHYNWRNDEIYEVSYVEGQRLFYKQVLMGDSTDGYGGCHLVGGVKADDIINGVTRKGKGDNEVVTYHKGYIGVEAFEHTFKRGKRAGEVEIRWTEVIMDDIWDAILSQYLKANFRNGKLETHYDLEGAEVLALQQARVARMLRNEEWVNNDVILWSYKPLEFDLKKENNESIKEK